MYFEIKKDNRSEYRLTLKSGNHEIIFTTEGYVRKINAENAAKIILSLNPLTPIYDRTQEQVNRYL